MHVVVGQIQEERFLPVTAQERHRFLGQCIVAKVALRQGHQVRRCPFCITVGMTAKLLFGLLKSLLQGTMGG